MLKHLQVFYTKKYSISDRLPYGDELKSKVEKQYKNAILRLANPDYDKLPSWMRLGSGNSMKKLDGYTKEPGIRVIKGCRPFLSKVDKTEMDLGYVQYFVFDIDVEALTDCRDITADDMALISSQVLLNIPRMEIDPTFIIGDAYINRSGSNTGFHLILSAEELCKMSITKAAKIKAWLYEVVKVKFIDAVNNLNINKFVMDDYANKGMKKLFFSDSQERVRHIKLVRSYNNVMNGGDANEW